MSFQDPMNPLTLFGEPLQPVEGPMRDAFGPLELGLLAPQLNDPVAWSSFGLPQDQLEQPLGLELGLSPQFELGASSAAGLLVGSGVGAVASDPTVAGGDNLALGQVPDAYEIGSASFSLEEGAEGLRILYSPPPEVQLAASPDAAPPDSQPTPVDEGCFAGLKESNRYRPASPEPTTSEGRGGRSYDLSRWRPGPRLRGKAVNPFRGRGRTQRCRRCGGQLQGNRCERCRVLHCWTCGDSLHEGKCVNESCPARDREACGSCGQEPCVCGGE